MSRAIESKPHSSQNRGTGGPMTRRALALLVFAFASANGHAQSTWYVDDSGTPPGSGTQSDPYTRIQYAIAHPSTLSGDTVLVLPGTYFENVDLLGKTLTVRGQAGAASTIVDASGSGSVLTIASGEGPATSVEGLTLRNGSG